MAPSGGPHASCRQSKSNGVQCAACSVQCPDGTICTRALSSPQHVPSSLLMQAPPRRQSPAPKDRACPCPYPHPHPHQHPHQHPHHHPSPPPPLHAASPHSPPRCADALPHPSASERAPSAPPPPPRTAACCPLGCADAQRPPGPRSRAGSRRWGCSLQGAVSVHVSNVL